MSRKPEDATRPTGKGVNETPRLENNRYLSERRSSRQRIIEAVAKALIAAGYVCLDKQAKALGINRSTAWTIINNTHKIGRLNTSTTERILANPDTPPTIRMLIEQYVASCRSQLNKKEPRVH